jgi:5-methylcytosine-specific restriction endonuclease McrA
MAHTNFLEKLFKAHLADLKSVAPNLGDVFICPICLERFTIDAIYNEVVTDGHVWPGYIREKPGSALATSQRILLCKTCNSTSGSRGDKQIQLLEKIKDAEKVASFMARDV